jgi:hypothetical protein
MAHENFAHVEEELRRTLLLLEASTDIEARKALLRKMKNLLDDADQILSQQEVEPTDASTPNPKYPPSSRSDLKPHP